MKPDKKFEDDLKKYLNSVHYCFKSLDIFFMQKIELTKHKIPINRIKSQRKSTHSDEKYVHVTTIHFKYCTHFFE